MRIDKLVAAEEMVFKRETDKARLVVLGNGEEKWIPKSLMHNEAKAVAGKEDLVLPQWFCEKEEIEYEDYD